MARIPMTNSFSIIPEGKQILRIDDVSYDEDFGKLEVKMSNKSGNKHTERFSLMRADGSMNEGAMGAFSYFAKNAMNNFEMEDIDPVELKGHFLEVVVEHEKVPNRNDPTKTMTFARLVEKSPASGFEGEETTTETASSMDLAALLG